MELQPSFLLMMSEQLKPQADVGVTYIYEQGFWAGLVLPYKRSFDCSPRGEI